MPSLRAALRSLRYSAPAQIERVLAGPGPAAAARRCRALDRAGLAATIGYFQAGDDRPEDIVAANVAAAGLLAGCGDVCLAVKAPPLAFDPARLRRVAEAAAAAGLALMFDAHAHRDAGRTLAAAADLLRRAPDRRAALEDVAWGLLNAKEFLLRQ
jgi:proline dehydrogenase